MFISVRRMAWAGAGCLVAASLGVAAQKDDKAGKDKDDDARRPKVTLKANRSSAWLPPRVVLTAELVGGAKDFEEYYCPTVQWDWADGTTSESTFDCPPYEAGKSEIRRRYTVEHVFRAGNYRVTFRLKRRDKALMSTSVKPPDSTGLTAIVRRLSSVGKLDPKFSASRLLFRKRYFPKVAATIMNARVSGGSRSRLTMRCEIGDRPPRAVGRRRDGRGMRMRVVEADDLEAARPAIAQRVDMITRIDEEPVWIRRQISSGHRLDDAVAFPAARRNIRPVRIARVRDGVENRPADNHAPLSRRVSQSASTAIAIPMPPPMQSDATP